MLRRVDQHPVGEREEAPLEGLQQARAQRVGTGQAAVAQGLADRDQRVEDQRNAAPVGQPAGQRQVQVGSRADEHQVVGRLTPVPRDQAEPGGGLAAGRRQRRPAPACRPELGAGVAPERDLALDQLDPGRAQGGLDDRVAPALAVVAAEVEDAHPRALRAGSA